MFRNIIRSRRVSKARKRLMALLPGGWITIPGISFDDVRYLDNFENFHSASYQDFEFPDTPFISMGENHCGSPAFIGDYDEIMHGTDMNRDKFRLLELPLSFIIKLLMKALKPDSIFGLDTVLRAALTVNERSTCYPGDCVHISGMYNPSSKEHTIYIRTNILNLLSSDMDGCPSSIKRRFPSRPIRKTCAISRSGSISYSKLLRISTAHLIPDVDQCTRGDKLKRPALCIDPLFAVCKAWRWRDLEPGQWLRSLPVCNRRCTFASGHGLCINPQHWSRVIWPKPSSSSVSNTAPEDDGNCPLEDELGLLRVGVSFLEKDTPRSSSCAPVGSAATTTVEKPVPIERMSPTINLRQQNPQVQHVRSQHETFIPCQSWLQQTSDMAKPPTAINDMTSSSPLITTHPLHSSFTSSFEASSNVTDLTNLSNSYDSPTTTPLNSSSPSSCQSNSDDWEFGVHAKKPRFTPTTPSSAVPQIPPAAVERQSGRTRHTWAQLSYWQTSRHMRHRWFRLTEPVVQVVYQDGDGVAAATTTSTDEDSPGEDDTQFAGFLFPRSKESERIERDRQSQRSPTGQTSPECDKVRRIRLASLVTHEIPSPIHRMNDSRSCHSCGKPVRTSTVCTEEPYRSPVTNSVPNFHTGSPGCTTRTPCDSRNSLSLNPSWRQCYRLGCHGLTLQRTPTGRVWLDNQTTHTGLPLFISSSCLPTSCDDISVAGWPVYRVPPGCSILLFDPTVHRRVSEKRASTISGTLTTTPPSKAAVMRGPLLVSLPVVHISLGKGWGPSYRRPDVTHCPARLELWLNVSVERNG